tara:strand:- start:188 stop:475 length:288 start_codon:yes stop_codon:yes gene_type:complete
MEKALDYEYEVEEYSQDARQYRIECNVKLTKEQLTELQNLCFGNKVGVEVELTLADIETEVEGQSQDEKVLVTFLGIDYGDDSQINISGDVLEEE